MAIIVSLRVSGVDFHDDERLDSIERDLPGVSFSRQNGFTLAEIFAEDAAPDVCLSVTDTICRLKSQHAVEVDEVEPLLVSSTEIAVLAGVTQQTVLNWANNGVLAFPRELENKEDDGELHKMWSLYAVNDWLRSVLKIDLGLGLPTPGLARKIEVFLAAPRGSTVDTQTKCC